MWDASASGAGRGDDRAAARGAAYPQRASQEMGPFAHPHEPEMAVPDTAGCEAAAVVADDQADAVCARGERDGRLGRLRVPAHVGERFLRDAEQLGLGSRREPRGAGRVDAHADPAFGGDRPGQRGERLRQRPSGQRGGAQSEHGAPGVL